MDSGYVTPETVHRASTRHGITVVGPVRDDQRAVERPGFAKEDFHVDWRAETVRCPQGTVSPRWKPTVAGRQAAAVGVVPDAKPPSQKPSTHTAYATADTADSRRPASNTSSPPPAPTSSDSPNTGKTNVDDREAFYTNSSAQIPPTDRKITNSIRNFVPEPIFKNRRQLHPIGGGQQARRPHVVHQGVVRRLAEAAQHVRHPRPDVHPDTVRSNRLIRVRQRVRDRRDLPRKLRKLPVQATHPRLPSRGSAGVKVSTSLALSRRRSRACAPARTPGQGGGDRGLEVRAVW